jgi:hypothetical protein
VKIYQKIAIKPVNMQKIAKLKVVYNIREMRNIFVSYFECSKIKQEKYAFARTSNPWLLKIIRRIFMWLLTILNK